MSTHDADCTVRAQGEPPSSPQGIALQRFPPKTYVSGKMTLCKYHPVKGPQLPSKVLESTRLPAVTLNGPKPSPGGGWGSSAAEEQEGRERGTAQDPELGTREDTALVSGTERPPPTGTFPQPPDLRHTPTLRAPAVTVQGV